MTTHKKDATKPSKLKNDSKNTTVTDSNKIVSQLHILAQLEHSF